MRRPRTWWLASVATTFLTVGGARYLLAAGDPAEVQKAKTALKSAAIGYALTALAPLIVAALQTPHGLSGVGDAPPDRRR